MKFGAVDFPQPLLAALRDKRLVVFAGAGVSMGPPARLPSFIALAKQIAEGRVARDLNPVILDRELGDLERDGVQVHSRCREIIQAGPPHANEIHWALLRLFGDVDAVRIVTTNYDPHFTSAAMELWQQAPAIYGAPALPLGSSFRGIVHVHGTLLEGSSMVLTVSDFGRAYLTEGWARRFLLDAFINYTVLFVGYSHEDTVMQYLARALPPALTKDCRCLGLWTRPWLTAGCTICSGGRHRPKRRATSNKKLGFPLRRQRLMSFLAWNHMNPG